MTIDGGVPEQRSKEIKQITRRDVFQKGLSALKQRVVKPVQESLGTDTPYPSYKQQSRREFLEGSAVLVGTAAALGTGIYAAKKDYEATPEGRADYNAYPRPEGVPEDILTKEELTKAGITVYQTKDTQLYLRRGVFDLPLFKDAKEKSIKGVVISLVESDSISWNSTSQLPMDARTVWQSRRLHPSEYPEEHWQELKKYAQDMIDYNQRSLNLKQGVHRLQESQLRSMIDYGETIIKISTEEELPADVLEQARKIVKEATETLQDFLSEEKKKEFAKETSYEERQINNFKHELEVLQDRPAAIDYIVNKGDAQGLHIDTRKQKPPAYIRYSGDSPSKKAASAFHDNPQWDDKVYLYLCVGGEGLRPNPKDSYPQPEWFESADRKEGNHYSVFLKDADKSKTGFIIRHEASHYKSDPNSSSYDEHDADHLVLETITKAWDKYEQSGDSRGYPFVFVNDQGVTITKNVAPHKNPDRNI